MAKKQKQAKAPKPQTVWQYECVLPATAHDPEEILWVLEDDERSASYKAISKAGTGRIRSKVINTPEANDWVVKTQDLLPR
ncbi:MAG: hypothetical protein H9W81_07815 [Enterococcus sp.]|nr:hypothetical protein [Enterococcus sp.]